MDFTNSIGFEGFQTCELVKKSSILVHLDTCIIESLSSTTSKVFCQLFSFSNFNTQLTPGVSFIYQHGARHRHDLVHEQNEKLDCNIQIRSNSYIIRIHR